MTAYDIAKESGHRAVCDELERHINQDTKTEITKVRVCSKAVQPRAVLHLQIYWEGVIVTCHNIWRGNGLICYKVLISC